jgi:hypothetical protein
MTCEGTIVDWGLIHLSLAGLLHNLCQLEGKVEPGQSNECKLLTRLFPISIAPEAQR